MRYHTASRLLALLLTGLFCLIGAAEAEVTISIIDENGTATLQAAQEPEETGEVWESDGDTPRDALIDGIISMAKREYEQANGRAHEAQYASSNYVCKNYTVYLFRENAAAFRMAEFPDAPLKIPDNKPREECTEYAYGIVWKDVAAEDGNPFQAAAQFIYDDGLSKEENWEKAREFLKQVRRGDYFQMAANYYYGVGAHSMIFIADYDPETDSVHWCDSNMKGEKRNGIRYGYLQFDAVKEIDWFVDAFCRKKHGATLYRLRDDIIYKP